jgi:hypothetical protein
MLLKVNRKIDASIENMTRYKKLRYSEKWRKGYHISDNTHGIIFYSVFDAVNRCYEAI